MALTTTSHQQLEVTLVIRFKIQFNVTNLNNIFYFSKMNDCKLQMGSTKQSEINSNRSMTSWYKLIHRKMTNVI
jgi:hypothetical protein